MEAAVHTCKNCGQDFEKQYCNACGQKAAHRLDVKHVLHEVFHVFTHTDKGILSFIPKILIQPGIVALDYVEGKRRRYFNIFQYLVIVVGLVTFLVNKTNYMESMSRSMGGADASAALNDFVKQMNGYIQRYFNLISFAFIPALSFFAWLFFKRKGYNYAEVSVLQTCLQAQSNTLSLFIFLPLLFLTPNSLHGVINLTSTVVVLVVHALGYRQFFKISWVRSVLASFLIYICFTILTAILVFLAAVIWKRFIF